MKILPSVIHICIKKGVQNKALEMLAERIVGSARENPSHIVLKRKKTGKFTYTTIYETKTLSAASIEDVYKKLLMLVKKHKKYIHLILKPSEININKF